MTTTRERSGSRDRRNRHLENMLHIAELAGCQLRPAVDDQLRGFCPLHFATNTKNLRTLRVNTRKATFWCSFCEAQGSPAVFAAHYWQVAVSEAAIMLQAPAGELSLERPTPLALRPAETKRRVQFRRQNTYLLTKAAEYYAGALQKNQRAQHFLHRLGIPHSKWDELRLGYATGTGLLEHLRRRASVSDEEISASPLFETDDQDRFVERHRGCLMVPNIDQAGNVDWMLTVASGSPDFDRPWLPASPRVIPISGMRLDLLGSFAQRQRPDEMYVTDDVRIWLILRSADVAALHVNSIQDRVVQSISQSLSRIRPPKVTVAMTRPQLAAMTTQNIADTLPNLTLERLSKEQILAMLPPPRDAETIFSSIHAAAQPAEPQRAATPRADAPAPVEADAPANPGQRAPANDRRFVGTGERAVIHAPARAAPPPPDPEPDHVGQTDSPAPVAEPDQPRPGEPDNGESGPPATPELEVDMDLVIARLAGVCQHSPDEWDTLKAKLSPGLIEAVEERAAEFRAIEDLQASAP